MGRAGMGGSKQEELVERAAGWIGDGWIGE